jgi:hypothetical protein
MEISLLFVFFAVGQAETALRGLRRFRRDDQSRIAGVCREHPRPGRYYQRCVQIGVSRIGFSRS